MNSCRSTCVAVCVALLLGALISRAEAAENWFFRVRLDPALTGESASGRLLVFLSDRPINRPLARMDWSRPIPFFAMDVADFQPGQVLELGENADGFPVKLSEMPAGTFHCYALLHHSFYDGEPGRAIGNFYSDVVTRQTPTDGSAIELTLNKRIEARPVSNSLWTEEIAINSPLLTKFHGREVIESATVILPPSYEKELSRRYPVVYCIPSFDADHRSGSWQQLTGNREASADEVEFIRVMLNGQSAWGHHVYANSVTNGPRGDSFVKEIVPHIDANFRTVAAPSGRFLTGHSSGGWSSLWLQVNYPEVFGGVWSSAPDPVDFRDMIGINIYQAPPANIYVDKHGQRRRFSRMYQGTTMWWDSFSRMDDVWGRGGQLRAFEAVFSPLDTAGQPSRLADRATGKIDSRVAEAWKKYDIRLVIEDNWNSLKDKLAGKIHITVGDADTFFLEQSVKLLAESLTRLGSDAQIDIIPSASHFSTLTSDRSRRMRRQLTESFLSRHAIEYGWQEPVSKPAGAFAAARMAASNGLSLDLSPPEQGFPRGAQVDDADLAQAATMNRLTQLNLVMASISPQGVRYLTALKDLKQLTIANCGLPDEALDHVSQLASLEKLNLVNNQLTDKGVVKLAALANLKELALGSNRITNRCLEDIRRLTSLTHLDLLRTKVDDQGADVLSSMKSLEQIDLRYTSISTVGAVALAQLPKLKRLDLSGTWVTPKGLEQVRGAFAAAGNPDIEIILTGSFPFTVDEAQPTKPVITAQLSRVFYPSERLPPADLGLLDEFNQLRNLSLTQAELPSDALRRLSDSDKLKQTLEELNISNATVDPTDIENLSQFTKLRVLMARSVPLGGNTSALKNLRRLENLQLDATGMTDADLIHLQNLRNLKQLTLRDCQEITDRGLYYLAGLRSLRRLDVTGTGLSPEGIDQLAKTLPACQFSSSQRRWEWRWHADKTPTAGVTQQSLPALVPPGGEAPIARVLIDASKVDIDWWRENSTGEFSRKGPPFSKTAADYLTQQRLDVEELPHGAVIDSSVLAKADIFILPRRKLEYSEPEVEAIHRAVLGGKFLLFIAAPGLAHDKIAAKFELAIDPVQSAEGVVARVEHPFTENLSLLSGPFAAVKSHRADGVPLAWVDNQSTRPAIILSRHGSGLVACLGFDAIAEREPRPLADIVVGLAQSKRGEIAIASKDLVVVRSQTIGPPSPTMVSPVDGAELPNRTDGDWSSQWQSALGVKYSQLLVYGPSSSGKVDLEREFWQDRHTVPPASVRISEAESTSWSWQVRSRDGSGNWGPWSSARKFSVKPTAPPTSTAPVGPIEVTPGGYPLAQQALHWPLFSSDQRWLTLGMGGANLKGQVWRLGDGKPISVIQDFVAGDPMRRPVFSRDGRWLFTLEGARDALRPRLIQLPHDNQPHRDYYLDHPPIPNLRPSPNSIPFAFSANSRWLATRGRENNRLWDLRSDNPTSSPVIVPEPQSQRELEPFRISENGRWLLAGNRLLDLDADSPMASSRQLPDSSVAPSSFSPDQSWLVAGKWLVNLCAEDGKEAVYALPALAPNANIVFSPDKRQALIGASLVDLQSRDPASTKRQIQVDPEGALATFSPDNRWLVVVGTNKVQVWDTSHADPSGTLRQSNGPGGGGIGIPLQAHMRCNFSADSRWMVVATYDGEALLFDLSAPTLLSRSLRQRNAYRTVAFNAHHNWMYIDDGQQLQAWDLTAGMPGESVQPKVLYQHVGRYLAGSSLSGDGRWFLVTPGEEHPRLFDLTAAAPPAPIELPTPRARCQISPDNRWLVTTTRRPSSSQAPSTLQPSDLHVWDLTQADLLGSKITLQGHADFVVSVHFSPDSRWLVTSDTRAAWIWDLDAVRRFKTAPAN